MTDAEIDAAALACSRGELDSFSALYDAFVDRIFRFVYYRTGHKETAEDITSEVFMKALRNINSFNAERARFSTWLYTIARNAVIDHSRTQHPTEGLDQLLERAGTDDPARTTHAALELEKVLAHLKVFTPRQQDILLMRLWDGMSHKEIAAVLGMSEAGVKMQFSRTLKQLQSKVGVSGLAVLISVWAGHI